VSKLPRGELGTPGSPASLPSSALPAATTTDASAATTIDLTSPRTIALTVWSVDPRCPVVCLTRAVPFVSMEPIMREYPFTQALLLT
jgi:hypothetical protein